MARIKLVFPENIIYTLTIPVRITDINYGNHLGNDALVSILHEARVHWLNSLNYSELNIEGKSIIMNELAVNYLKEMFYGDVIKIDLSVGDITGLGFELYYRMSINKNGENLISAIAKTGLIFFDHTTKKTSSIPDVFLEKIKAK
ncbi:MAG: thioesterase family protein [Sphingobacteriales bacterium]|nr:thioesterase family protein [Sphingobacteriales bacterium]